MVLSRRARFAFAVLGSGTRTETFIYQCRFEGRYRRSGVEGGTLARGEAMDPATSNALLASLACLRVALAEIVAKAPPSVAAMARANFELAA